MASYVCDKCNKVFRGNYELNRHNLKKFPCVKEKIPDKIPNEEKNKVAIIEEKDVIFGTETIEEIPKIVVNDEDYYILAVKFIIEFHKSLIKDNLNIWLTSINSFIGNIISENGKEVLSNHYIMDIFLKKRSEQLLSVLEKNEDNKMLIYHLENFMLKGILHKDNRINTSNMKIMIKISLLKNKLK